MQTGAGNGTESAQLLVRGERKGTRSGIASRRTTSSGRATAGLAVVPRRKQWRLGLAVLIVAAGVLLRLFREGQSGIAAPATAEIPMRSAPPDGVEADSPLRRLALLPGQRIPEAEEGVSPPGSIVAGAERLGEALSRYPEAVWPEMLGYIRRTRGRETCPFLWVGGNFAFILPEAAGTPEPEAAGRPEDSGKAEGRGNSEAAGVPVSGREGAAGKVRSAIASLPAILGRCAQAVERAPHGASGSDRPGTPFRSNTATSSPPDSR